jgi:fructosamine-3-kinase
MTSATKFRIETRTVQKLFEKAGIAGAEDIVPLTAGEFNSAFKARSGDKGYVIKIAHAPGAKILTYEKDMMRQELACYEILGAKTEINTPKIFYSDFSCDAIPSPYFIMEEIPFPSLAGLKLADDEAALVRAKTAEVIARYHHVAGAGFGYAQNGLYPSWDAAIKSMVQNLVNDAKRFGRPCPMGEDLLVYIEKYRDVLKQAPCRLVNFDLWDSNMFYEKASSGPRLWLIDPERWFWGDPAADLVCLDIFHLNLEEKTEALAAYNKAAKQPFIVNRELKIRYNIMLSYLAVLMWVERYSRYHLWNKGWWRNTAFASMITKNTYQALKEL